MDAQQVDVLLAALNVIQTIVIGYLAQCMRQRQRPPVDEAGPESASRK